MKTMRELLIEAIEVFEEERNVMFVSNSVDGVVTDRDAIDLIAKYDAWIRNAKAVTGQN
jgi:hypothetical protein